MVSFLWLPFLRYSNLKESQWLSIFSPSKTKKSDSLTDTQKRPDETGNFKEKKGKKITFKIFHQESALLSFAKWPFMSLESSHPSRSNSKRTQDGAELLGIPQAAARIHFEDRCSITFSQLHTKARNPSMCSLLS